MMLPLFIIMICLSIGFLHAMDIPKYNENSLLCVPESVAKQHIAQQYLTFGDIANLKLVCKAYNKYWTTDKICPDTQKLCACKCSTWACNSIIDESAHNKYGRTLRHFAFTDDVMFWHLFRHFANREQENLKKTLNIKTLNDTDIINLYRGLFVKKKDMHRIQEKYLRQALAINDIDTAQLIIETMQCRPRIFAKNRRGSTLLEAVCGVRDLSIFQILIEKNKRYLNRVNKNDLSVLQIVATQGTNEMLKELLKYKHIDINFFSPKSGKTALHFAASAGKSRNVTTLCKHKADTNLTDDNANTPLHCCIKHGRHKTAVVLLNYNKNLVNRLNVDGSAPLHLAAHRGALKCGNVLLLHGACLNIKDILGKTPLHIACQQGKVYFVEWLLDNGSLVNVVDDLQRTPLDSATGVCKNNRKKRIINLLNDYEY